MNKDSPIYSQLIDKNCDINNIAKNKDKYDTLKVRFQKDCQGKKSCEFSDVHGYLPDDCKHQMMVSKAQHFDWDKHDLTVLVECWEPTFDFAGQKYDREQIGIIVTVCDLLCIIGFFMSVWFL